MAFHRTDSTHGAPLRILSLGEYSSNRKRLTADGGGVRGYSMLILLNDFMHKVYTECHSGTPPEPDRPPKPCDYFDLIGGTGTGGLIAIMLGRLRMNIRDCMRIYVQMTRKVFETDKTIAGIPYRSTLFKASLLEDAIRACVREYEREHDDPDNASGRLSFDYDQRPESQASDKNGMPRSSTSSSRQYSGLQSDAYFHSGNPDALLEDSRRTRRTKTAVTAVLKGPDELHGTNVLLRSYPSRTQPAIENECVIWQAGRATCATKLAFKEIRIGTSTFLDEGNGLLNLDMTPTYNPAPQILEEAVVNEWPGQPVGLFLSIGTGRRPGSDQHSQTEWWEGFAGGLGSFAEAKRKLIAKIEGCEKTHQAMLATHLPKRGISLDHYLRLNVEVGVGEFGMNEWHRLADISNNTQAYLNAPKVKSMMANGAVQMAKVETFRSRQADLQRHACVDDVPPPLRLQHRPKPQHNVTPPRNFAVELPGSMVPPSHGQAPPVIPPKTPLSAPTAHGKAQRHGSAGASYHRPPPSVVAPVRARTLHHPLPYPDTDGPPPVVNLARKPHFVPR